MSKNIFLYNRVAAQNDIEVNKLKVNEQLTLTGADPNELLITDSNSNIITFNNGPSRYILEIDPINLKPSWTNTITVDDITTNTMTINNTQQADVIVIGDTIGSIARLPKGLNNQVLVVDNGTFGLNYKYIKDIIGLSTAGKIFIDAFGNFFTEKSYFGTSGVVAFTNSTTLYQLPVSTIGGNKYTVTVSFNNTQPTGNNTYSLAIDGQGTVLTYVTSSTSSQENISWSWVSGINGTTNIQLIGAHLPNTSNGTVNKVHIIVQPLGQ